MDRLTSMRVFALAAQVGTLSGAARVLDMSPAMATKHVDALEARLGVKLLHRTTRKLTLTEAGEDYLEATQRILNELDDADAAATSQRTAALGGMGLVYEPSFIVGADIARGDLQAVTLDEPTYDLGGIHAVWPANRHPPAKVRVMVDFLVERLATA